LVSQTGAMEFSENLLTELGHFSTCHFY